MKRLTRLLSITIAALLLLAAAGPALSPASAADELPPEEVLKPTWYWISDVQGSLAGTAATGAGDVNGDGYDDVIVGAPLFTDPNTEIYKGGAAFVFHGMPNGLVSSPSWMVSGDVQGKLFGQSAAGAGDVNGDGLADVIVGAPNYDNNHGKVYVYHGSYGGLSKSAAWSYTGLQRDTWLGWSVAGAGDVNNDGYDDVLVGAIALTDPTREGEVFLFLGSPDGLGLEPAWSGQINQLNAQFGYAVSAAGDLNKDGFADVIIGAPYYKDTEDNEGAVFVYYGSDSPSGLGPIPNWAVSGQAAGAKLGWSVAGAGDVNGDGYPDLAAGAPGWEDSLGAVFVYHGSYSGPSQFPDWMHLGSAPYTSYGKAVGAAGEVNGDGYDDLIIGASKYSNDQREEGIIYVHHGGPLGLAEHPGWRAEGDKSETFFGHWVAAAGDINKDGFGDIVVGAPEYKTETENKRGGAFVYHGFLQEVVDGEIIPIDPVIHNLNLFLPVMTR